MRPIDADAIEYYKGEYPPTPCASKKYIDSLPTIEPKRGKWLKIVDLDTVQCSECFEAFDYIDGLCYLCHGQELPNYCPNCGARMDGKEQKGEIK